MTIAFVYNSAVKKVLKLITFTFEYNLGIYIMILCWPYIITATVFWKMVLTYIIQGDKCTFLQWRIYKIVYTTLLSLYSLLFNILVQ